MDLSSEKCTVRLKNCLIWILIGAEIVCVIPALPLILLIRLIDYLEKDLE